MKKPTTLTAVVPTANVEEAWQEVGASFERFCLTAGLATLSNMMEEDAVQLCGPRYGREDGKAGHRWGKTKGKLGFHGGKVELERPRIRARGGREYPPAELGGGGVRRLAGQVGDELDADQRLDTQVRACGPPAGGRYRRAHRWRRRNRQCPAVLWRCQRSA